MSDPKRVFLFLDIDGVLNSDAWLCRVGYETLPWPMRDINPICCARLLQAITDLPVDIVLSSSWRMYANAKQWMEFCGVKIFDITPDNNRKIRGLEIADFFSVTPFKDRPYLILDDETDFLPQQLPFLVRTNVKQGLNYRKTNELREKLKEVLGE